MNVATPPGLAALTCRNLGRALAIALCLAAPLAQSFAQQVFEESEDATREALRDGEWFDYERDDYRRYRPEDIKAPESPDPADRPACNPAGPPLPGGGIGVTLMQGLLVLIVAVVLAAVIALLVRLYRERGAPLEEEIGEAKVEHGALPEWISAQSGLDEELSAAKLRGMIIEALNAGDRLRAAIYIFLFALAMMERAGWIEERREFTAREYLRAAKQSDAAIGREALFVSLAEALRCFEHARYNGTAPANADLSGLWSKLEPQLP